MSKLFYYTGMLSILMLIMLILLAMFMAFYPFRVVEVQSPYPIINENRQVKRGEEIYYLVNYNKHMQVRAESTWFLECSDGSLITLAPTSTNFPIGRHTIIRNTTIPTKVPLGECKIEQQIQFFVNPLQVQTFEFESEPFIVVE